MMCDVLMCSGNKELDIVLVRQAAFLSTLFALLCPKVLLRNKSLCLWRRPTAVFILSR